MENQTFTADLITNIYFNQTFHVDLSTSFMGNTMTTPATEKETSHPGPATLRLALAIPLLIMATVGNSLAFAVMRRRSMRNTSPGVYFAAIACADTVTVYWGAVPFLIFYFTSIDLWSYHPWSCRVVIFTLFTSADSAVWLLVAVTVDRFIAVKFPLARKQMCTPKRAFIVACVLPSIASIENLHLFLTQGRQVIVDAALWILRARDRDRDILMRLRLGHQRPVNRGCPDKKYQYVNNNRLTEYPGTTAWTPATSKSWVSNERKKSYFFPFFHLFAK